MTTRIAVFSDLHGNSAATEAVLAAVDAAEPDTIFCLGDLVGYGARPFGDGKGSAYGFALGDINRDGWPDIALARSGAPNVLYLSGK